MTQPYVPGGPARAVRHINAMSLWSLPTGSAAPDGLPAQLAALAARGVEAIQHPEPDTLGPSPLPLVGMTRIDAPSDADRVAREHKARGYPLTTLHVGTGFEDDEAAYALLAPVVEASDRHAYPLLVETHRATVTQDIRRTLDLTERLPELRFNADLSHWYTGHEMTYGDVAAKVDRIAPVLDRVRYVHGRIGDSCCMQVALAGADDERDFVGHFRLMWTRLCEGFARTAGPGEVLPFAAELLPHARPMPGEPDALQYFRYARLLPDGTEESDRWEQAEVLWAIFADCARAAGLATGSPGREDGREDAA